MMAEELSKLIKEMERERVFLGKTDAETEKLERIQPMENGIQYRWTDGNDPDFQRFYRKTEEYYSRVVGGLENRREFVAYNASESVAAVLVAYVKDAAIGCSGLKPHSDKDVEIKRVWVDPEYRRNHIAEDMMALLEERARRDGYHRMILQTREIMKDAVSLYQKLGYQRIDNYPPYDSLTGAVCLAKVLQQIQESR